jgi:serine/threonine protein kinase
MPTIETSGRTFWSDGPVGQEGIYVERKVDSRFSDSIFRSGLCYLLGPSQVGKSSLLDSFARRFRQMPDRSAVCVHHELNYTHNDANSYELAVASGIADAILESLDAGDKPLLTGPAGPLAGLNAWLVGLLSANPSIDLFIFIDEVDTLAKHPDVAERFMLGLRGLFGIRASNRALHRLHIALFGALLPLDMRFNRGVTPLNIGDHIYLRDMTELELQSFLPFLNVNGLDKKAICAEVYRITSGQPFLTQVMFRSVENEYVAGTYLSGDEAKLVRKAKEDASSDDNGIPKYIRGVTHRVLNSYSQDETLAMLDLYARVRLVGEIDVSSETLTHYATRLTGLVEREFRDADDAVLRVRNSIISERCGERWIALVRQALNREDRLIDLRALDWGSATNETAADHKTRELLELTAALLDDLSTATGRTIERDESVAPIELIEGKLYRFPVIADNPPERLSLQLFVGLRGLSGDLWAQEIRILQEVSHSFAGSLPDIMDGGLDDTRQIAWVLETRGWDSLDSDGTIELIRSDPLQALRQFTGLSRGLSLLHQAGILHRSIWPSNIQVIGSRERPELMFTGFEFSTVIFGTTVGDSGGQQKLYDQYIGSVGAKAFAHLAPERLLRMGGDSTRALEGLKSDVFSLGMLAYQLFAGPISTALYEATAPSSYDDQAHRRILLGLQLRLAEQAGKSLPAVLAESIANMLAPDQRSRPTTSEVLAVLEENEVDIRAFFEDTAINKKMMVCYSVLHSGESMAQYGLITSDYRSTLGRKEIQTALKSDLQHGARLFFCPTGFDDYVNRPTDRTNSAKYVLQGTDFTYFCRIYRSQRGYGSSGPEVDEALWIAYVYRRRIPDYRVQGIRLDIRDIEVISEDAGIADTSKARQYPSWRPFLDSLVRREWERDSWNYRFHQSTEWLLRMQQVLVQINAYPVTVIMGDAPGLRTLIIDEARDERWRTSDPFLFTASESPWRRPPLARYCDRLVEEGQARPLLLFRRGGGDVPPRASFESIEIEFVQSFGPNAIGVRCYAASGLADGAVGWVESAGMAAQDLPLARQRIARQSAMDMPNLTTQFDAPKAIIRSSALSHRAGIGLLGEAPFAISEILNNWPFYALQGPPGTGKTTIISRCIATLLKAQPSPRILVAAQSHFALDNVAKRVAAELTEDSGLRDTIMIRIASSASQRQIDDEVKEFLPSAVGEKWRQEAIEVCRAGLSEATTAGKREVILKWHNLLETNQIEFEDRLKRSANVVFCTTGAAHDDLMEELVGNGKFDWVFIEEAAKAWLTELLMPMVYGRRWVLVGDHRQLPAFGLDDLTALLHDACISEDADLKAISSSLMIDQIIDGKTVPVPDPRIFAPFEAFMEFESREDSRSRVAFGRTTRRLTTQFRMCRPIGDLVSEAFYGGALATADKVANYQASIPLPMWIKAHRLLWISTSELKGRQGNNHRLESRSEANMVRDIIVAIEKENSNIDLEHVAILSPYQRQKRLIEETLLLKHRGLVRTVDSFQGREADIIIVSLTRTREQELRTADDPRSHIGFLGTPNRVNVMMSRARAHLIVIGDYDLYSEIGELPGSASFWGVVCRHFHRSKDENSHAADRDVWTYDRAKATISGQRHE